MGVVDELVRARETYERGDWASAFGAWSGVSLADLAAGDCAALATTAELLGRYDESIAAHQRAFQLYTDAGDTPQAARCACLLGMLFASNGDSALGAGWASRAQRLLDDLGEDVAERGFLDLHHMYSCIGSGDFEAAFGFADSVLSQGRRFEDADLTAMGLASTGRLSLYANQVPHGLALFDEAMVSVTTGEVSPVIAGRVYCVMIEGCQEVGDLGRASAWTTALARWCSAQPGLVAFTGQCALHRGQIMGLHGAFAEAVEEFDAAVQRYLASPESAAAGTALAERGDVLRILGDLDGAEESYDKASGHGFEPQPGLALLWLAKGRTKAALAAIRRLLAETPHPVFRSRLLPAAVEILGTEDPAGAREAAAELERIATGFGCDALKARAAYASGRVELAAGDASGSLPYLRKAGALWSALEDPYDFARTRVQIGLALRALGDDDSAATELSAAHRSFVRLGARPAAVEVAALMQPAALPRGLTAREVEVLRLVATGRNNSQIADELVLSGKTVARHLSNIYSKLEVGSRTAAAAFAFEHDLA